MRSYLKFLSRNKLYTSIEAVGPRRRALPYHRVHVGFVADVTCRKDESGGGVEERIVRT